MKPISISTVMISCEKRKEQRDATLKNWMRSGPPTAFYPFEWAEFTHGIEVVMDHDVIEGRGLSIERPQSRQEHVALAALERGYARGTDYVLFLEDDLIFNPHLYPNLCAWGPLSGGAVMLASLYNPNVVGTENRSRIYENTSCADPAKVYGSQAFLMSRRCVEVCIMLWWGNPGMQDIKISRIAGRYWPIFYHTPSLVQHVGTESAWATDGRFHQAMDFDPEWRAQ